MKMKFNLTALCLLFMVIGLSAENLEKDTITAIMKDQSYYRLMSHSSRDIEAGYIGYDENDNAQLGVIIAKEDIYEDITIIMTVAKEKGQFKIIHIEVPDMEGIKDAEKKARLSNIISKYEGQMTSVSDSGNFAVDAVSGASRFIKKGHKTFNSLFGLLVEEMKKTPHGEKILLN